MAEWRVVGGEIERVMEVEMEMEMDRWRRWMVLIVCNTVRELERPEGQRDQSSSGQEWAGVV